MAASLYRQSLATLLATLLAASALLLGFGFSVMGRLYDSANSSSLGEAARAFASTLPEAALLPGSEGAAVAMSWLARASEHSDFRLTLIRTDGVVVADTMADPATMENHGARPEVRSALSGGIGSARRRSATVGRELLYAAAPVLREGRVAAVLRLALEAPSLDARLASAKLTLVAATLVFLALAAVAAALFSRRLSGPLARLAATARGYSSGERRPPRFGQASGPEEVRSLARSLDSMAAELEGRIRSAEKLGSELEAILSAMVEAVLALDEKLEVRLANPAAAALFATTPEQMLDRGLLEATRSTELQAVAESCLRSGMPEKVELALYLPAERWFQALAAPMGSAASSGVVLVMNDITELRRLERVRRDFVANVSHELRTPVQVVKGFTEALAEALGDPEKSARYLGIVARNAERMESLIGDLLTLARLEQGGGDWLRCERIELRGIIAEALDAIAPKAEAKRIHIEMDCPAGLEACANAGLIEQAIINLLDNAVKYSPQDSEVHISARREGPAPAAGEAPAPGVKGDGPGELVLLEVRDRGPGIPAKDLSRLFERFYRVDKARSRELGGTGLGLAIVRHIALAHGGSVSVESWEGEGSTFRLRIPVAGPPGAATSSLGSA
jgi:two-component system phosphate regulon sensor histidine kinase PhoR